MDIHRVLKNTLPGNKRPAAHHILVPLFLLLLLWPAGQSVAAVMQAEELLVSYSSHTEHYVDEGQKENSLTFDWEDVLVRQSLPQFDPAMGTLMDVVVSCRVDIESGLLAGTVRDSSWFSRAESFVRFHDPRLSFRLFGHNASGHDRYTRSSNSYEDRATDKSGFSASEATAFLLVEDTFLTWQQWTFSGSHWANFTGGHNLVLQGLWDIWLTVQSVEVEGGEADQYIKEALADVTLKFDTRVTYTYDDTVQPEEPPDPLQPVPEPSTNLLLGLGLLALARSGRRVRP
jgi:hypothetical protein